ncbi:MAG: FkbM family methyltransferase [Verrucomicrobiota bacterium]
MDKKEVYRILDDAYFGDNPHEKELLDNLGKLLPSKGIFLDVGASLGQFSRRAASLMAQGQVIAIEADPLRFERLEKNFQEWSQEFPTISFKAIHAAVSDRSGRISFQTTNSNISGGLATPVHDRKETQGRKEAEWEVVEVPSLLIDDALDGACPDLVKMDIEGAEGVALKGATRLLNSGKPEFLIELHNFGSPDGISPIVATHDIMRRHGYRAIDFHGKTVFGRHIWRRFPLKFLGQRIRLRIGSLINRATQ